MAVSAYEVLLRLCILNEEKFLDFILLFSICSFYQKVILFKYILPFWGFQSLPGLQWVRPRHYRVPVLSQLSTAGIELSRNTPLLDSALLSLYFGLPRIRFYPSEACAVVGLIRVLYGGVLPKWLRNAIALQIRSSKPVYWFDAIQVRYVVLPQAVAVGVTVI